MPAAHLGHEVPETAEIRARGRRDRRSYSFHPGGVQVTFGDGAVKFINEEAGIDVLSALTTRNGGGSERKVSASSL